MDILQTTPWWPLLWAALLAFGESAPGLGAIFPGEVTITALAATLDASDRPLAIAAVALGATAGDHVGYALGRHFGVRLASSRVIQRVGRDRWDAATGRIQRRGAPAVFVSRLLPLVRTVMPAVAGVAGLRYARFAVASVAGSILWATLWVTVGGAVGALGESMSPAGLALSTGLGAITLAIVVLMRRRARRGVGLVPAATRIALAPTRNPASAVGQATAPLPVVSPPSDP